MKTDEVIAEFRKIKQEYSYNPDIMNEEDERLTKVKKIIDNKLSLADKTIILLYAVIVGNLTIPVVALIALLSLLSVPCGQLLILIREVFLKVINKLMDLL